MYLSTYSWKNPPSKRGFVILSPRIYVASQVTTFLVSAIIRYINFNYKIPSLLSIL